MPNYSKTRLGNFYGVWGGNWYTNSSVYGPTSYRLPEYASLISSLYSYVDAIKNGVDAILDTMRSVFDDLYAIKFNYFYTYPPDDILNQYNVATQFSDEWVAERKPFIVIVNLEDIKHTANEESLFSFDRHIVFTFDVIYPFYNESDTNQSFDAFLKFVDLFTMALEKTGTRWENSTDNKVLFVNRSGVESSEIGTIVFAETLCHFARFRMTFNIFEPYTINRMMV